MKTLRHGLNGKIVPDISCKGAADIADSFLQQDAWNSKDLTAFWLHFLRGDRGSTIHVADCPMENGDAEEIFRLLENPNFFRERRGLYFNWFDPEEEIPDISCAEAQRIVRRFRKGERDLDLLTLFAHLEREGIRHKDDCPAKTGCGDVLGFIEELLDIVRC